MKPGEVSLVVSPPPGTQLVGGRIGAGRSKAGIILMERGGVFAEGPACPLASKYVMVRLCMENLITATWQDGQ